jgi:RNA polymerase sigma factor (sigma-70 family)
MRGTETLLEGNRNLLDRNQTHELQHILHRYCLSLTGSSWEAEDLAQEAWLKALSTAKTLEHTNPEALMLRIAKNTWIDWMRRNLVKAKVIQQQEREGGGISQLEAVPSELEHVFHGLIKHLSPLQRTVFVMRDVLDYSTADTAEQLGMTIGAVKAVLHRARHAKHAVRQELLTGSLTEPLEESMKAYVGAIASAYLSGEITALLTLIAQDAIEPAVAIGMVQSRRLQVPVLNITPSTNQAYHAAHDQSYALWIAPMSIAV